MGKSAKLHKRVSKKLKSGTSTAISTPIASSSQVQVESAKKRSLLRKGKKTQASANSEKPILGDADYVSLMMGGRRKAREEARKLPQDSL
ncbi:hypothetical protein M413DRAFT_69535 [Hebeloma cylindrosporum]|uniref:Uncharacterized protein n=1 Tax=Hebeloma cylindrosporum TaxID=76867 RepID=A0A0C3CHX1_HEBCY|nr:hypothetical protein M413DRAFT_69535 [Hebeloma cylindrosporum h7]